MHHVKPGPTTQSTFNSLLYQLYQRKKTNSSPKRTKAQVASLRRFLPIPPRTQCTGKGLHSTRKTHSFDLVAPIFFSPPPPQTPITSRVLGGKSNSKNRFPPQNVLISSFVVESTSIEIRKPKRVLYGAFSLPCSRSGYWESGMARLIYKIVFLFVVNVVIFLK